MNQKTLKTIKSLVGENITKEDLKFVDCYVSENLSIFVPVGGNCGYGITPNHTHPSYMFLIPYDFETEIYVGNKKFQTSPKTISCLSPFIPHYEIQNYLPPKYSAIFIQKEFFEKRYGKEGEFSGEIVDIKSSNLSILIKSFFLHSYENSEEVMESLAILITHQIIKEIKNIKANEVLSDSIKINRVIEYININFSNQISIEELSKVSGYSKSHFTKLFSEEMRISPMEYLKRVRVQNSKKMLLQKEFSITKISQICGFNSPAYFTKIFKEIYNETPKEYRVRESL